MAFKIHPPLGRFLKDNNVYSKFVRNYISHRKTKPKFEFLNKSNIPTHISTIETAFAWSCTPEGYVFWDMVFDEYHRYLRSNKNK